MLQITITEISQMSITSSQLKQELFEKTGGCYLRNEKFPVTSMEEETISGFNNFVYANKKVFCSRQRRDVRPTLLRYSAMLNLNR